MWTALRQRNVALLWVAGLISVIGDWVIVTALPFYVYDQTHSAFAVSAMFAAYFAPRVLASSLAGVFVDRWDRKRTLVLADLLRVPLLLALLLVHSGAQLWIVYAVVCIEATIGQFFLPAKSALVPSLIDDAHLEAANALNALNNNLGRLIGSAIAGVTLGVGGLSAVALLDSATYLLSAGLIGLIVVARPRTPTPARAAARSKSSASPFWHELWEGLRLIRSEQTVVILFVVFGMVNLADSVTSVLFVVFVQESLRASAAQFGAILAAGAFGGLLAGVAVERLGHSVAPKTLIGGGALGVGSAFLAMFHFPSFPGALALSALLSFPLLSLNISGETLLQRTVADQYRGRIQGIFNALVGVLYVVGLAGASLLTEPIGLLRVLDGSAALYLVAGIVALVWFRKAGAAQAPADAPPVACPPIEGSGGGHTGANCGS